MLSTFSCIRNICVYIGHLVTLFCKVPVSSFVFYYVVSFSFVVVSWQRVKSSPSAPSGSRNSYVDSVSVNPVSYSWNKYHLVVVYFHSYILLHPVR